MWRDPFEEFKALERRMNRLFEEMWGGKGSRALPSGEREIVREPFSDIVEKENEIKVAAEIPGVNKEDIKIDVSSDRLEISAQVSKESEKEEEGYLSRERSFSKYYRAFRLPAEVDAEKAEATYKNGVLEVTLPKKEGQKKSTIKVE